ncbi:hypothetical protein FKW77_004741 [Venturia effusa]|uniref:TFIIH p62 subunit N-terminal domain-containing protein n=1 Tax=Venturia effusa TaxID=50376 RepID=A0A517LH99_9PEZI|nr:hypothetical protein FKW77_004741 [Venturia effusa]
MELHNRIQNIAKQRVAREFIITTVIMSGSVRVAASYLKKPGTLEISADRKTLSWRPAGSTTAALTIVTESIDNLKQTPVTAPKAILNVVVKAKDGTLGDNKLTFTSPNARSDLTSILDPLKEVIAARGAEVAAALLKANASTRNGSKPPAAELDDASLIADRGLQKEVLEENPAIGELFASAIKDAPDKAAFDKNFWAARIGLLRAKQIAKNQHQGETNVLSEIKPSVGVDGKPSLKMSTEQRDTIFNQHPLVETVFKELVEKTKQYTEIEFWQNFWVSHLVKKLKGEKITDLDPEIPMIDKFALNFDEKANLPKRMEMAHTPRFLDLDGNDQDFSQQKGNAPDWTMKPNFHGKVQLLHILNNTSERLMYNVAASDTAAHGPVGMDEDTFNELQLRDLERAAKDNRIMLNVNTQKQLTAAEINGNAMAQKENRTKALKALQADMRVQVELPTELEEDDEVQAQHATKDILKSVKLRATSSMSGLSLEPKLDPAMSDSVRMTHSTTVEFLRYFWTTYFSGDDRKAHELQQWSKAVTDSLGRIEAIADKAEEKRKLEVANKQKEWDEYKRQGGKRRKLDLSTVSGGRKAVEDMMAPTRRAVLKASGDYARVYSEQLAQAARQGPPVS